MKMPKPKPVVRWIKLAPMLSRNMEMTMLLILFLGVGIQFQNLAPACSRIGTLKIVLDGIGKNIGLSFAILLCVLL